MAIPGVDPKIMGIGPITAVRQALKKAGLSVDQIDVIESNEAFAAQACAVARELGFHPAKLNPNGGAIALGHPIAATGCILTVKAIAELQRTSGRYALVAKWRCDATSLDRIERATISAAMRRSFSDSKMKVFSSSRKIAHSRLGTEVCRSGAGRTAPINRVCKSHAVCERVAAPDTRQPTYALS